MAAKKRSTKKQDAPVSDDIDFEPEPEEAPVAPKIGTLYWVEFDCFAAPQQAESPDCAARRSGVTLRVYGTNRVEAVRTVETALQRLIDEGSEVSDRALPPATVQQGRPEEKSATSKGASPSPKGVQPQDPERISGDGRERPALVSGVNALSVDCPICGAFVGKPCIYDINNLSKPGDVHNQRYINAAAGEKAEANGEPPADGLAF